MYGITKCISPFRPQPSPSSRPTLEHILVLAESSKKPRVLQKTHIPKKQLTQVKQTFSERRKVQVAIDFGTTYTGYAFSFDFDYDTNPMKIRVNEWRNVPQSRMYSKVPSAVLFNPQKEFHSFGYDATEAYTDLVADETQCHGDYFFFWNFKMCLHTKQVFRPFHIFTYSRIGKPLHIKGYIKQLSKVCLKH